jgi:hypothetical protein
VAEVVETGAGVTHIAPRDLVVVPWHASSSPSVPRL